MLLFKPREVVEFAMNIEKNGQAFYRALAGKAGDAEAKNVFVFMADEEDAHYNIFKKLAAKMESFDPPETYPGEYEEYMRELVDNHIFTRDTDPVELAGRINNSLAAVDLALGFEKDSILFFHELKKLMPDLEQRAIDELIAEEGRHVKKLLQLKKLLSGKCDQ